MKKLCVIFVMCMMLMPELSVCAANVRGGTISVRPTYTPGIGVNIPKQTVIGTTKPLRRPVGGFYPAYGVYYSGVRYTSRRNQMASNNYQQPQVQTQVVKVIQSHDTPQITSCNGLTFYDKDGNITRCR